MAAAPRSAHIVLLALVLWVFASLFWPSSAFGGPLHEDSHLEALDVERLAASHVRVTVSLRQTHNLRATHPTTFPLAVLHLVKAEPLSLLTLDLSRGRWDFASWGAPRVEVHRPGAAVSAVWRDPGAHRTAWTRLMHRLSGLLCASLNLAAQPESAPPQHTPGWQDGAGGVDWEENDHLNLHHSQEATSSSSRPRHTFTALLPHEAVCTENLTPWLKLLPCGGDAGVAHLLHNPTHVLAGDYHSLSLSVAVNAPQSPQSPQSSLTVSLVHTFTAVLRVPAGAPAALTLAHVVPAAGHVTACAAVTSSHRTSVRVRVGSLPWRWVPAGEVGQLAVGPPPSAVTPPPVLVHSTLAGTGLFAGHLHVALEQPHPAGAGRHDRGPVTPAAVNTSGPGELGAGAGGSGPNARHVLTAWPPDVAPWLHDPSDSASSTTRDLGNSSSRQHRVRHSHGMGGGGEGGLGTHDDDPVVCVQQVVPWVLRVWLHTQAVTVTHRACLRGVPPQGATPGRVVWQRVTPAREPTRPLLLTTCVALPRTAARVVLTWRVTRGFLHLEDHPPDAHRGWDVPPPRVWYASRASGDEQGASGRRQGYHAMDGPGRPGECQDDAAAPRTRLHTVLGPGLLVQLATADVAMPYNVICLTSTVLAVYLGASLNVLLRRRKRGAPVVAPAGKQE